jgi:hypothetical protein
VGCAPNSGSHRSRMVKRCSEESELRRDCGPHQLDRRNRPSRSHHPPNDRRIAGTSVRKVNAREMVTGKHQYTTDCHSAGMLYGRVLRSPSFGAKLLSADTTAHHKYPV